MLVATPPVPEALERQLDELDELRGRLADEAGRAGSWLAVVGRRWRVSSALQSLEVNSIPDDEVVAVANGRSPGLGDHCRQALASYARALDHVGVMAGDPHFRWVDRVVCDLHFEACSFQRDAPAGRYRDHDLEVPDRYEDLPPYVGPPPDRIPRLMHELAAWLDHGDPDVHVAVRAAMAQLHLHSILPFADGNRPIARLVETLVIARAASLAPEFVAIETSVTDLRRVYEETWQEVEGCWFSPDRDAGPWVALCVQAHLEQVRRRLDDIADAEARWSNYEEMFARRGWPARIAVALEQSLFGHVDRISYAMEADVSMPTASDDLERLAAAGLIVRSGNNRLPRHVASKGARRILDPLVPSGPIPVT